MPRDAYSSVYEIAADQFGYITASQARDAGVGSMALVMMERRRTIERVSHGVYRLLQFPISALAEYMEASLWPVGVAGVISHESALALYGITDVNPGVIHVTIPVTHRVRRRTPGRLRLHHSELSDAERELYEGIPVTRMERTIRDCLCSGVGGEILERAVDEAEREGFLQRSDARRLRDEFRTFAS